VFYRCGPAAAKHELLKLLNVQQMTHFFCVGRMKPASSHMLLVCMCVQVFLHVSL